MTGRGAGYCAGFTGTGYANVGRGMGRGYRYGGRGCGYGWGSQQYFHHNLPATPNQPDIDPEKQILRNQINDLQAELSAIKKHLGEIASGN